MEGEKQQIQTIENLNTYWTVFSEAYSKTDSCMQTFYYTLIHMLDLPKAKHILEVACGTGRLLSLATGLKPKETTYLATDLTQAMIDSANAKLKAEIEKVGVTASLEDWKKGQNLTLKAANGEEPIESPHKFDRIIANLVIMATEDPSKMMKNFHSMAAEGCLLGVTIWGDQAKSNFFKLLPEAFKAAGVPRANVRSPAHLYGKLPELAEQTGWEIVVEWEQNAPFPQTSVNEDMLNIIKFQTKGNQSVIDHFVGKINAEFAAKKALNFPCQLAILRKK